VPASTPPVDAELGEGGEGSCRGKKAFFNPHETNSSYTYNALTTPFRERF